MLFNSLQFLVFFPAIVTLYFLLPHRFRWALLLAASCYFYMAFIPVYILILFFTIAVDYIAGILIEQSTGKKRKAMLIMSIVANVGVLAVFKYYNFFAANVDAFAHALHWNYSLPILSILLPIGLSFHTFQAMSYTIEVYRGNQKAERHLGIYALYVMFFPQLVAGPIERPQNLLHQFYEKHHIDIERIASGLRLMLWGFFKKIVIADNIAQMVNHVYDYPHQFVGWPLIVTTILFSFQIYCDFSGYSDIAVGSARVLGFKLMNNFNRPFAARSISEFWRRWHISLSTWFRDYVYIPLGGNRTGRWRWYFNLFFVFLVSGLWHGANWTFIVWGSFHGIFLVVSLMTQKIRTPIAEWLSRGSVTAYKALSTLFAFFLVSFSFIFFHAHSLSDAWYIVTHLFSGIRGSSLAAVGITSFDLSHAIIAIIFFESIHFMERNRSVGDMLIGKPAWIRWTAYNALMLWILFFGFFGESPFIYFQF